MEPVVCDGRWATGSPPRPQGGRGEGEQTGGRAGGSRTGPGAGEQSKCESGEAARQREEMCVGDGQVKAEAGVSAARETNQDRIQNRCLIGNWQEEQISAPFDQQEAKATTHALAFKNGHKGLLSIDYLSKLSDVTTYNESYPPPKGPEEREIGIKKELIEKYMYRKICKEVYDEHNEAFAIAPMESLSVTGQDFKIEGFKSVLHPPVKHHDYKTEQPITIWSDHVNQIHGVTDIKTGDTPFRKNASFTRPIMEALDT